MTAAAACRDCPAPPADGRVRCAEHLERARSAMRAYLAENRERINAERRARYRRQENFDRNDRDKKLRQLYGITLDEYEAMSAAQGHVCAICGEAETARGSTGRVKSLAVDHCHETGKVRALLCARCNGGLGCFSDSLDILALAFAYLESHLMAEVE